MLLCCHLHQIAAKKERLVHLRNGMVDQQARLKERRAVVEQLLAAEESRSKSPTFRSTSSSEDETETKRGPH